jgi:hypothetical protein
MLDYPIETVAQHIAAPVERIWALLTTIDAVTSEGPARVMASRRARVGVWADRQVHRQAESTPSFFSRPR